MVAILATSGRRRSNRKTRVREPLRTRVTRLLEAALAADVEPGDEGADSEVVPAPRVMAPRVMAWIGAAACLALMFGLVDSYGQYALRTRQFQVRDFQIIGNHRLTETDVIDATGVRSGNGLLQLSPAAIRAKLEQLPWIRAAHVHTELPARLVVEVEEYVPVAIVADGELQLVDDAGHVIAVADRGLHEELPFITGLRLALLHRTPDDSESLLAKHRLRRLLDLIGSWQLNARFELGEVNWDAARGVTLLSATDGAEIRIGHATDDDVPQRFSQIARMLDELDTRGQQLRYALLDDPMQPARGIVSAIAKGVPVAAPPTAAQLPAGPAAVRAPGAAAAAESPKNQHKKRRHRASARASEHKNGRE